MTTDATVVSSLRVGGKPLVGKWDDLGPALLKMMRSLPVVHRYRGKLTRELFGTDIFTPEEKKSKVAVAAVTEMLGVMERQGLVKKTGRFVGGNELWAAVGEINVDLDLSRDMAAYLTNTLQGDWNSTGVLEERGSKFLCVKTAQTLPVAVTGGHKGVETVEAKIKYDPRWPHLGLKFSYDVPLRSDIRRNWRSEFEKKVLQSMTEFGPSPVIPPPVEPVSAPEEAEDAEVQGKAANDPDTNHVPAVSDEPTDRGHHQDE